MIRSAFLAALALTFLPHPAGAEEKLRRFLYAATPDGAQPETASGEGLFIFDIDNGFKFQCFDLNLCQVGRFFHGRVTD